MTYPINPQNQRIPGNYSGVTINIANPSLSSVCPQQQCPQVQQSPCCHPEHQQLAQMSYPSEYYLGNYNQPQVMTPNAQYQTQPMQQAIAPFMIIL